MRWDEPDLSMRLRQRRVDHRIDSPPGFADLLLNGGA